MYSNLWAGIPPTSPITAKQGMCSGFSSLSAPCLHGSFQKDIFPVPKGVHDEWHQEPLRDFAILVTIKKAQGTLRLNT